MQAKPISINSQRQDKQVKIIHIKEFSTQYYIQEIAENSCIKISQLANIPLKEHKSIQIETYTTNMNSCTSQSKSTGTFSVNKNGL